MHRKDSDFTDRFELKREARTGGMGTVYQAIDRRSGAVVALKVLHVRTATETARFDQEARLLAELSHPGIVRYFDRGTTPHGAPFIVMEWLEGETLEERLSRGSLGPAAVVHVAYRVLDALAAAHERGVVHRDIKPSNVFLVGGRLTDTRILDFGIARRVFDRKRFTRKGSTVGTPRYTAPEQARGRSDVDGRADIFSLGCVLYEALAGEAPFVGDSAAEVMQKVCAGAVAPLSSRRSNLPPELEQIINRMLASAPGARPQAASAAADEFRALAQRLGDPEEEAASAEPPSPLRPSSISESETRILCAMLLSLVRRTVRERPLRTRAVASTQAASKRMEGKDDSRQRVNALASAVLALGGEMDHLIGRTLLVTAPAVGTARDQAMQIARAALVLRDMEPDAKIAIGSGRAAFTARVLVGSLMDSLPALMQGQQVGSIRVDETTRRLLSNRFVIEAADGVSLLVAEAGGVGAERPRRGGGQASPLLGRARELDLLLLLRRECVRRRVARAALVVGEPGAGKTRLAREFFSLAADPPENTLRCTGSLVRRESDYALLGPLLAAAGIESAGREAAEVKREFVQWLRGKCTAGHPIMVLEDLQWADPASVQLLDDVLGLFSDQPLLVLALGRPEVEERFAGLWAQGVVETIRLAALPQEAGQSLLRLRVPPLTAEAEQFVLDRWEGNPMFLEEMADAIAAGHSGVPDVVLAAVEARLDCLSPEVRQVLRVASLYGDCAFSTDALLAVLGESARQDIAERLDDLIMRDFVVRQTGKDEATFMIRSPLVRESAYGMLTSPDRVFGKRLARAWLLAAGKEIPPDMDTTSSLSAR